MQTLTKGHFKNLKDVLKGIHSVGYIIGKREKKR